MYDKILLDEDDHDDDHVELGFVCIVISLPTTGADRATVPGTYLYCTGR
jgi:hypothetical protein